MRKLTPDIYKTLKANILNKDVPRLFHSMLFKQGLFIFQRKSTLDKVLLKKIDLFQLFVRQYNTILVLANTVCHIGYPGSTYLDVTSVNILIRSCHERFLTFWYLTHLGGFQGMSEEEELRFKWLCYRHGGFLDEQRTFELLSPLQDTTKIHSLMADRKQEKSHLFQQIRSHPLFNDLSFKVKKDIENKGAWRIGNGQVLSWSALGNLSPINSDLVQSEYQCMSLFSHPTYQGIDLDINHNGNIDGLLAYLYILAASFIFALDNVLPGSDVDFTSSELACTQEFLEIAAKHIKLPPFSAPGKWTESMPHK